MLRSSLSELAATASEQAQAFEKRRGGKALVGRPVYGRHGDQAGFVVELDEVEHSSSSDVSDLVGRAEAAIVSLNRICQACTGSAPGTQSGKEAKSSDSHMRIVVGLQPQMLSVERFTEALIQATAEYRNQGVGLCVGFEASDLALIQNFRKFRQVLYKLGDYGIDVIMGNPVPADSLAENALVIERAVSAVSITPEWLGIGIEENAFDYSRYTGRSSWVGSLVHEEGKTVIVERVQNQWQASLAAALPIAFFSFVQSENDVYI